MQGDLRGQVGAAAEAVDAEPAAWRDAAAAQRAVADDPGTQQGCRVFVVERVRQGVGVCLVGDARVRIPAVEVPTGELRRGAEVLVAAPAVGAAAVGARQPRHADPVTDPETVRTGSHGIDQPDDLVAGDGARPVRREVALGQVQVRPADPTAGDADEYLPGSGHRGRPLDPDQRAGVDRTRRVDHPRPHGDLFQAAHRSGRDLGAAL